MSSAQPVDRVPVPGVPPGAAAGAARRAAIDWSTSAPMRRLAEGAGWPWPSGDDAPVVHALAARSDEWDSRGGGERYAIPEVAIRGEAVVLETAEALGLVHAEPPAPGATCLVVLSGQVRACVNRIRRAAALRTELGLPVVVLTGNRPLGETELHQVSELGLPAGLTLESEVVLEVVRATLASDDAPEVEGRAVGDAEDEHRWRRSWAHHRWADVDVVTTASRAPAERRANTSDQLAFWAERAGVGVHDDLALVTTQIYAPYQALVAIEELAILRGCGISVAGVDAATASIPTRAFVGRDYLQEVRSGLLAASSLLRTLDGSG